MARCSGCNAEIVWARSPKGAQIPLERVKTIYALMPDPDCPQALPLGAGTVYVSHFVTCPKRDRFSGRNRKRS